ncbi:MAG TPA: hypothetical protein VMZ71_05735 [Gemmataceae bacterium]|nr:hypothetical protein [Gemmataceae bacterium]
MDLPAAANGELLQHPRLGVLRWHPLERLWFAEVDRSRVRDGQIGVASAADLDRAAGFLDWLGGNWESFRANAAYQAFNHDLIWDEELDEHSLAAKLTVQSVTVRPTVVEVWLDTDGATTDHLLLAKLNGRHEIVGMEL